MDALQVLEDKCNSLRDEIYKLKEAEAELDIIISARNEKKKETLVADGEHKSLEWYLFFIDYFLLT